jgi:magnesium transporter
MDYKGVRQGPRTLSGTVDDLKMEYELLNLSTTEEEFENEAEFLQSLLAIQDLDELSLRITARLEQLETSVDYAKEYSKMRSYIIAIKRIPAITVTILLELIVGYIVSEYAHVLEKHILLTSFLPVLSALGGNLGLQASTTTLRAIGSFNSKKKIIKVIFKEAVIGCLIGAFSGIITAAAGLVWSSDLRFAYTTFLSVFINCAIGALIGSLSPVFFVLLKIDPALMSGPLGIYYL